MHDTHGGNGLGGVFWGDLLFFCVRVREGIGGVEFCEKEVIKKAVVSNLAMCVRPRALVVY